MANSLRMPMASSSLCSSSSPLRPKRRSFSAINSSKIPMPPINPNDPFISKLVSVAAASPDTLLNRPKNSDNPPFLHLFDSPKLMATPAHVERSVSYSSGGRRRSPPPDLPSLMLDNRVVYIGMPLVPAVTELVIVQLLHLQYMDPVAPIYLYINSTGTTNSDGEPVGREAEGFAIYDVLAHLKNEIHTLALGAALGHACLLLAAGTKGKRFMLPHAQLMIQQPRIPPSGLIQASDVMNRAREAMQNRDTLVKLLAKHTGNTEETVAHAIRLSFYMTPPKAKAFGVIDKILSRGQEEHLEDMGFLDEWDRNRLLQDVHAL